MNKTELSIGDWVKVPKLVYDNGLEDFGNGMCKVRRLRDDDLDVYSFNDLNYSDVEPILITKTILMTLGFVEKYPAKEYNIFEFRTDDLLVNYSMTLATVDILKAKEKIPEPHIIEHESGNMIVFDLSAKILYLHQLQHLLRLVGMELNKVLELELMSIYEF